MTIIVGDCRAVMASMEHNRVDAIVTDPPYGIGFMGKAWDTFAPAAITRQVERNRRKATDRTSHAYPHKVGQKSQGGGVPIKYDESPTGNQRFQEWCEDWATECLRILKPGGQMLVCGGPRTFHRLTSGIEDAGFEIRDVLTWLHGSGFPKSHNLHGAWEGWGTALKPGWEPIVLARKPLSGTVADTVAAYGTGAMNIDACRIGTDDDTSRNNNGTALGRMNDDGWQPKVVTTAGNAAGRWPANVLLDEVASGIIGDKSRFFFTAKSSRTERNAGLAGMPVKDLTWSSGELSPGTFQSENTDRSSANHHPTVKPLDLMRWLVRLITPAGGLVLDPFTGSGSTGCAAVIEGMRFTGIELNEEYAEIARRRIRHWHGPLLAGVAE